MYLPLMQMAPVAFLADVGPVVGKTLDRMEVAQE